MQIVARLSFFCTNYQVRVEELEFFGTDHLMNNDDIFQSVEKPKLAHEVARHIAHAIEEGWFLPGQMLLREENWPRSLT